MIEVFNQGKESVYRQFIKKVRDIGFVRVVCISREIDHFAALFSVLTILEKELIKHEVVWERREKEERSVFEIGIGEGCEVRRGAVLSAAKEARASKDVILLCGETLELAVFNLCKSIGHLTPDCLWSICVSTYGQTNRIEQAEWRSPIRKNVHEAVSEEEEEGHESYEEKENINTEETGHLEIYKEIVAEIGRLERDDEEKKSVLIKSGVYFPFSKWTTLYEALLNDFGVIEELGLFFQRKNTKHCLLENAEYLLNQFLAKLGVAVAAAQETSLNNLVGPIQKVAQRSFNKRHTYFKHYQYNLGFSHIEVFYSICALIKKGSFIEAVFAFRNIKYIDAKKGLLEYKKVVQNIKKSIERRKVLRVNGIGLVLIPKGAISFRSENETTLMKKVFVNVCLLCKTRNPHKEIIMTAYVEESKKYRVFFKNEEGVHWVETEEKTLNQCIKGVLERLVEED
ncbi:hypothetical protein NEMIN01_0563 [Nematocida minor]|uniref:uncharacterized protein n=1 Tax=Nematocida minor TaxID=1912983 RepID=UPI00221F52BE|nr:uncharacterized protein NEMIN01_0563 [Nematocida minor]KAI5189610.1 hypothetical protein NEMIN01_0563 [Nematocida minor]